jgi:hypothetical protein
LYSDVLCGVIRTSLPQTTPTRFSCEATSESRTGSILEYAQHAAAANLGRLVGIVALYIDTADGHRSADVNIPIFSIIIVITMDGTGRCCGQYWFRFFRRAATVSSGPPLSSCHCSCHALTKRRPNQSPKQTPRGRLLLNATMEIAAARQAVLDSSSYHGTIARSGDPKDDDDDDEGLENCRYTGPPGEISLPMTPAKGTKGKPLLLWRIKEG